MACKGQTHTRTHTQRFTSSVTLMHHMRWQTEVSFSLSLTNTYNQHLLPSHLRSYHDDKNTEHSFSGCPGDTNYRVWEGSRDTEFRNNHNDAGERRSGTPSDEQGLSYTHTPLPGLACVCVCVYEQLAQIPQGHVCMPALL